MPIRNTGMEIAHEWLPVKCIQEAHRLEALNHLETSWEPEQDLRRSWKGARSNTFPQDKHCHTWGLSLIQAQQLWQTRTTIHKCSTFPTCHAAMNEWSKLSQSPQFTFFNWRVRALFTEDSISKVNNAAIYLKTSIEIINTLYLNLSQKNFSHSAT